MTIHRHPCHHRPRVGSEIFAGIRFWRVSCLCGYRTSAAFWRTALVAALIHSEALK